MHEFRFLEPQTFHFVFQVLFNALERFDVTITDQAKRLTGLTGAARAADAVHVIFGVVGQIEIHHHVDAQNVQTAGRQIGGHHDVAIVIGFELLHHAVALRLSEQARDAHRRHAVRSQEARDALDVVFEIRENDRLARLMFFEQREQVLRLLILAHVEDRVLHVFGFGLVAADVDLDGVGAEFVARVQYVKIQGRAEHQELAIARNALQDELHVVLETHIEHAVGFIKDHRAHQPQIGQMLFVKIDQAPRSRDHELDALFQSFDLFFVRSAAVNRNAAHARVF